MLERSWTISPGTTRSAFRTSMLRQHMTLRSLWRAFSSLALAFTTVLAGGPGSARADECLVGVNVNSFQNFSADEQHAIVDQLKRSGVRFVRTSLRLDDKNMQLAKLLQSEGIGLVL